MASKSGNIRCLIISLWMLLSPAFPVYSQSVGYLTVQARKGDGIIHLLRRYELSAGQSDIHAFTSMNKLGNNAGILEGRTYQLPVSIYTYNGKSIRSTIGIDNWDIAVSIRDYNDTMFKRGLKKGDYRKDKELWVPLVLLSNNQAEKATENRPKQIRYPIFGKEHEVVDIKTNKLQGHIYYVVSGHGGPDPGAIGIYQGHKLCEDEYAYDIALRLARCLLENGATVYMIIRDFNDGIRSGAILKPDTDEKCYESQEIPINQLARLQQRAEAINRLYAKHKKEGAKAQTAIFLHLDSRSSKQRIDMFFYHAPKSDKGKKLATILRNNIDKKYSQHQKNRGYSGTVEPRNLYVLRKTLPVAVFVELGNIKNPLDQKRFILEDNRQAVAKWLCEGLMEAR